MNPKKTGFIVLLTAVFLLPAFLLAASHYDYVYSPKTEIYFGHISYTEVMYDGQDPVVLREGEKIPEVAVLNLPLTAGDVIITPAKRRCEIQFDTGTMVRLDHNTELKIETILAQSLSSRKKLTNLVLKKGQIYVMYKKYNSRELFQVITAKAAVKMSHKTVAIVRAGLDGQTDIQVKLGKAEVLYGADEEHLHKKKIKKLQRLTVSSNDQVTLSKYEPELDFELWNKVINENFQTLHKGRSFLPKPIQKLPPAVFYFAQKYSNLYGEWVWNSLYGYVWRPNYNDYYPWGRWQPYFYGQWREIEGQLFWVPEESWGWVPYHLGLWLWDEKYGWIWLPGSAFAPAWVAWNFYMGYYTWRPWSLWDWWGYYYYPDYYLGSAYDYYYYAFPFDYWQSAYYRQPENQKGRKILHVIRKDQLQRRENLSYPLPKSFKKPYQNFTTALKKNDERVLSLLKKIPESIVVVKAKVLNAPQLQKVSLRFDQISGDIKNLKPFSLRKSKGHNLTPYQRAVGEFKRNAIISELGKDVMPSFSNREKAAFSKTKIRSIKPRSDFELKTVPFNRPKFLPEAKEKGYPAKTAPLSKKAAPRSLSMRIRDWNPDVKVAQKMSVAISYASRSNEIRCPSLGLSSKNVAVPRFGLSLRRGFYSAGGGSYSSSGSVGGSQTSTGSPSGSSSSAHSSSGGGAKGGGGAKKN